MLLRHPEVGDAFAELTGRISEDDMRAMNAAVDVDHRDVGTTVRDFLSRLR
jgi:glycine betaine/choline ABC-type transport system substrate-binding protein